MNFPKNIFAVSSLFFGNYLNVVLNLKICFLCLYFFTFKIHHSFNFDIFLFKIIQK